MRLEGKRQARRRKNGILLVVNSLSRALMTIRLCISSHRAVVKRYHLRERLEISCLSERALLHKMQCYATVCCTRLSFADNAFSFADVHLPDISRCVLHHYAECSGITRPFRPQKQLWCDQETICLVEFYFKGHDKSRRHMLQGRNGPDINPSDPSLQPRHPQPETFIAVCFL
jgi:hypothetical protein